MKSTSLNLNYMIPAFKPIFFFAVSQLIVITAHSQSAYHDALLFKQETSPELRNQVVLLKIGDDAPEKVFSALKRYAPEATSMNQIKQAFDDNPFINISGVQQSDSRGKKLENLASDISIPGLGGLNVTNFADGLARFLVERVKEELSSAYFTRFKEELEKYPDLNILFPTTYTALQAIDTEIYNYSTYINLLREAFLKDFQIILPNLRKLVLDPRYQPFFAEPRNQFLKPTLLMAITITEQLQYGKHPGDILRVLAEQEPTDLNQIDPNLRPALQTLNLLVQSVRSSGTQQYLVPFDSISRYVLNDPVALKIYLGLLYQQAGGITFTVNGQGTPLQQVLAKAATDLNELRKIKAKLENDMMAIADRANTVQQTIEAIREQNRKPETKATYREYYAFYTQTLDLLEYVASVAEHWSVPLNQLKKDTYFMIARAAGQCYLDVNEKKYASAVIQLFSIYEVGFKDQMAVELRAIATLSKQDAQAVSRLLNQFGVLPRSKEVDNLIAEIEELIKASPVEWTEVFKKLEELAAEVEAKQSSVAGMLVKYGNFGAQLAAAESSEQVKELIESIALPTGSSSIKRKSDFNVSLNAYVGLFTGYERVEGIDTKFKFNSFGVTAPVGVSISRGHSVFFGGKRKRGWSSSVFLSVIDIGAIAAFRFNNDSTESVPTIELKDIISPGAFYSLGIPKSPLSINLGYQVGPLLRKVTATGSDFGDSYGRFSISFCVDIPILNFYTRARRER